MNKKKMLAVVAAVAMTAAMSLPVFAEDATPGEISEDKVEVVKDLLANKPVWDDSDKSKAKEAIAAYVSNVDAENNNIVTEDMATCAIEAYSKMPEAFEQAEKGTVRFYSEAGQSENITLNKLDISGEKDSVTIDVKADNKSKLGYIVDIPMPGVADGTEYSVVSCSDEIEYIQGRDNANENFSFKVKDEVLTIWAAATAAAAALRVKPPLRLRLLRQRRHPEMPFSITPARLAGITTGLRRAKAIAATTVVVLSPKSNCPGTATSRAFMSPPQLWPKTPSRLPVLT